MGNRALDVPGFPVSMAIMRRLLRWECDTIHGSLSYVFPRIYIFIGVKGTKQKAYVVEVYF